ncbi:ArsR family transcriptional regulator [Lactobacillus delbrueckii]|nr:ArsR family transcriptional regulator [Lactobacillus delbrueckii]
MQRHGIRFGNFEIKPQGDACLALVQKKRVDHYWSASFYVVTFVT